MNQTANNYKTIIIAEAGVNHNGDINKAKQLIEIAADAGVDFVKFQTFKAEKLVTPSAEKAEYQKLNDPESDSQFKMLKQLELSVEDHYLLKNHAQQCGVKFLSTGFDLDSMDFLHSLGLELFKIPSGEITNLPYLKKIAQFGKPIILSTGMSTIQEIQDALNVIIQNGVNKSNITVLHCNTDYPTNPTDANLGAMMDIQQKFQVNVGYSDHTEGIEVSIAAVALGAKVIEKHFTLNKNLPGPDHLASLEPQELKQLVKGIRTVELALSGSGLKSPTESELKNKNIARKGIYYSRSLPKGHILQETDLDILRPFAGVSPMQLPHIIGKPLKIDVHSGQAITTEDI